MKQIVLNVLNDSRNTGRRIDLDSASALLRWMHAAPGDADIAKVQTCCLLLLGQWVNAELYRPLSTLLALHHLTHDKSAVPGTEHLSTERNALRSGSSASSLL